GGSVDSHVHSFEESIFVVAGRIMVDTTEGTFDLGTGDYGLLPVGVTHAIRNTTDGPVEFAEMEAPLPRARFGFDTQFPEPLEPGTARPIDVRDDLPRLLALIAPH